MLFVEFLPRVFRSVVETARERCATHTPTRREDVSAGVAGRMPTFVLKYIRVTLWNGGKRRATEGFNPSVTRRCSAFYPYGVCERCSTLRFCFSQPTLIPTFRVVQVAEPKSMGP